MRMGKKYVDVSNHWVQNIERAMSQVRLIFRVKIHYDYAP